MLVASSQRALYQSKRKIVDASTSKEIAALRAEATRQSKLADRYRAESTSAKKKLHATTTELGNAQQRIAELEKTLKLQARK